MRLRWYVVVPVIVVVMAVAAVVTWHQLARVHQVSVSAAVERYREQPQTPGATGGPEPGVYLLDTKGSERISVGGLTHAYPSKTTLTVLRTGCGLQVRWDALDERWMEWQLCWSAQGWRLRSYVDVHKFLYMTDRHDYTCANDPVIMPARGHTVVFTCGTAKGTMTIAVATSDGGTVDVAGVAQRATLLHVVLHATGASKNDGTTDVWIRSSDALPLKATVVNHGSQEVLGNHVQYDESASYSLLSTTPLR